MQWNASQWLDTLGSENGEQPDLSKPEFNLPQPEIALGGSGEEQGGQMLTSSGDGRVGSVRSKELKER